MSAERAIFDVRVWIEADSRACVFELIEETVTAARAAAPAGVDIRSSQLRPGHPLSAFKPTIEPKRRTRGRRAA